MFTSRWSLGIFLFLTGFLLAWVLNSLELASGETFATEQLSPSNYVKEDQIQVFEDKIVLNVQGATWASFADTNSMDPFLDEGANALQFIPKDPSEVAVGDVVSYVREDGLRIIHRVVYQGNDEEGIYFILKGDNNKVADPGKVRFEDIDRVLFAVIW